MKTVLLGGLIAAFLGGQDTEVWLDQLDIAGVFQQLAEPRANKSFLGNPLRIGDRTYEHGIGTDANCEMTIDLKGAALRFEAIAGVDAEMKNTPATVIFQVYTDGKKLFDSGVMKFDTPAQTVNVDVKGAKLLKLVVTDNADGFYYDHADWAMAKVVVAAGAKEQPAMMTLRDNEEIRTPKAPPTPRINGPRIFGARPGHPFLYTIPATGEGTIDFSASGLPDGLTLDGKTGCISGIVKEKGTWKVRLTAKNSLGEHSRTLEIVIGDTICLTPPMGWNSWNCWAESVDSRKMAAAADAMVKSGLAGHGWTYVNIDDTWERKENARDPGGVILSNEKFPDMRELAAYVHRKGLKIGLYSSPGPRTCAGYEGSEGHEELDAKTWAAWGFDYIKYDWCTCRSEDRKEPYRILQAALEKCDRDIVYSVCQYGGYEVWEWAAAVGGNLWRVACDIEDTWTSMSHIGFEQDGREKYAGPGRWNDPDMLVVGKLGWSAKLHPTRLRGDEQYTHITLWCLQAAPLLIGCDLTQIDDFTMNLLANDEVLAVDQDPLGKQGHRVRQDGDLEVWMRPLWDGTVAVGLFNRGMQAADVSAVWKDLGLSGAQPVRDLWRQKDLGEKADSFTMTIAAHGAELIQVGRRKEE